MFMQLPLQPSVDTEVLRLLLEKRGAFIGVEIPGKISYAENVTGWNTYVCQVCVAFRAVRITPLIVKGIIKQLRLGLSG